MSPKRVTVQEASKILGVTEHAIRQRLYRGTLESEKDGDGRVFVLLEQDINESPGERRGEDTPEMVEMLADQVRYLRAQLDLAAERDRENRRIIAALTSRIPELPSPAETSPEATESPVSASESRSDAQVPPEEERRSWWRRLFEG